MLIEVVTNRIFI